MARRLDLKTPGVEKQKTKQIFMLLEEKFSNWSSVRISLLIKFFSCSVDRATSTKSDTLKHSHEFRWRILLTFPALAEVIFLLLFPLDSYNCVEHPQQTDQVALFQCLLLRTLLSTLHLLLLWTGFRNTVKVKHKVLIFKGKIILALKSLKYSEKGTENFSM